MGENRCVNQKSICRLLVFVVLAAAIYANFFTHHFIADYRGYLACITLGLYARTTVQFTPLEQRRSMPLLLSFVLIGLFIWLAENIGTFFGVWRYPNQIGAWATVRGKRALPQVVAKVGATRYKAQVLLGSSRPALTGPYVNTLGASHGVRSLRAWRDQRLDFRHERRGSAVARQPLGSP